MNIDNITLSDSVEYLLSDFFDTVVSRSCHPEEVKMRWCAKIIDVFSLNIDTQHFYDIRIKCEAAICQSNFEKSGELEFKYKDLLALIFNILRTNQSLNLSKELFLSISQQIELNIEKKVQYLNKDVVRFFEKAKIQNKKIYIISDFYMDANFIKELAEHHEISHLIDEYFTSADSLKTKRSGNLYDTILNEKNINPTSAYMIGDNHHSDVDMSIQRDMYALHIPRDFSFYKNSLKLANNSSKVKQCFLNTLKAKQFDFDWMSIPLFIFIAKLHNRLIQDQAKNVVFLAREGEFLKELFDIYNENSSVFGIKSHYMFASRRGTYLPSLRPLEEEDFSKLLNQYSDMSLKVFIDSLGLADFLPELEGELDCIDFNTMQPNFKNSSALFQLLESKTFRRVYEEERASRKEYLASYVDKLVGKEELYLVDVGWKGSIQDNIQSSLNRPITGYYCGILRGAHSASDNNKHGLLFHEMANEQRLDSVYNEFRASYEVFCSASHGSLIKYTSAPEFGVLENNEAEIKLFSNHIRPLQLNLRTLFKELLDVKNNNALSLSEIEAILKPVYEKSVFLPKNSEMNSFSKLEHYENFGVFEFSAFDGNSSKRLTYIKSLISNPKHTIGREWWKPLGFKNNRCGFLKYPYFLFKKLMVSKI
ncbi:HAD hydrolase-like protein [uncultured Vibrio sp.]|uniref:HAD hydrolase-like protein n=1 Tax=uncultured Vibrio sp. TaxID=114054 RepID=UPI0026350950|nr:HAD hydrolase-like protein [uncultured Vibrio sp.]